MRRLWLPLSSITSILFIVGILASDVLAQAEKNMQDRLTGTWNLLSIAIGEGPTRVEPYGPSPKGIMFLDGNRFSVMVVRAGLPKFAAGNREKGTDEENKAIVQGSIAYFGSYGADGPDGMVTMHIDGASYPNFDGQDQKRLVALDGDELTMTNPAPSAGGGAARQVWRRQK